jgi:hypothetical protein
MLMDIPESLILVPCETIANTLVKVSQRNPDDVIREADRYVSRVQPEPISVSQALAYAYATGFQRGRGF